MVITTHRIVRSSSPNNGGGGRHSSARVVLIVVIVSACLSTINFFLSLAIHTSSTFTTNDTTGTPLGSRNYAGNNNNNGGMEQYLGFLPVQLLRDYFPTTTTAIPSSQNGNTSTVIVSAQLSRFRQPPLSSQQQQSAITTRSTTTSSINDNDNNNNNNNHPKQQKPQRRRRWAYAFLMAGVNAKHPGYRGILYNVLVSAEFLRHSRADIVLMVQMAHDSPFDRLLPIEEEWLHAMNVTIQYLDLPDHGVQNFYTVQLEKFHILEWYDTYSRVLFMDGDVMPLCGHLDYLFELSDPVDDENDNDSTTTSQQQQQQRPLLKQNLIMAWTLEPAHGGFFMLAPYKGAFQELEAIVLRHQEEVYETGILFNETIGWGHAIERRGWKAAMEARTNTFLWDWHGDFVDQGLLYYWTKYYKKDVSIVINSQVENWGSMLVSSSTETETAADGNIKGRNATNTTTTTAMTNAIFLERTLEDPFDKFTCVRGKLVSRPHRYSQRHTGSRGEQWSAPYRDFIHFTGVFKPWLPKTQEKLDLDAIVNKTMLNNGTEFLDALQSPQELWYYTFWKIHDRLHMGNSTVKSSGHFQTTTKEFSNNNRTNTLYWRDVASFAHLFRVDIRNLDIPKMKMGGYPTYGHVKDVIKARTGRATDHIEGWTQIEDRKKAKRKYKPW